MQGHKLLFASDLSLAYNLAELDLHTQRLLAVTTRDGVYFPTRLPLGPSPAPAWFQNEIETIFRPAGSEPLCTVFIDDIAFGESEEDAFLMHLEKVLQRCIEANAKLSVRKTSLVARQIEVLGHVMTQEGLSPSLGKLKQIQEWPLPKNKEDLQSFICLVRYLGLFTTQLQEVAEPLKEYELGRRPFSGFLGDAEALQAFEGLKTDVSANARLVRPDYEAAGSFTKRPFEVFCDASQVRIAWAIAQRNEAGQLRIIKCASHTLNSAERNWSTLERELYAIVRFIQDGFHLVRGFPTLLYTDHKN